MNKVIGLPRVQKRIDFVEKSNKKYKTTADKKRREKLFEEKKYDEGVFEEKKNLS